MQATTQILQTVAKHRQRVIALFFLVLFFAGTAAPTASAIAAEQAQAPAGQTSAAAGQDTSPSAHAKLPAQSHLRKVNPSDADKPMKQAYPAGEQATVSTQPAAADAQQATASFLDKLRMDKNSDGAAAQGEALKGVARSEKITPHELTDKRTANSTTSVNADGTLSEKYYFTPQFYKRDGGWKNIDTTLVEDKNAGDADNFLGRALGQVESWMSSTTNFQTTGNDWTARFSPSGSSRGMVRIKKGDSQIGYVPVGAKDIAPVITTAKDGQQTVHYYDLWPGVNVEYRVEAEAVKENIIIKGKDAANSVAFKLVGASLEKHDGDRTTAPYYVIKGALSDEFGVTPANLILNNFGLVTDKGALNQSYDGNSITLGVDKTYLQGLPDTAFPAVIDPGTFNSSFGTRAGGNYVSFKSDGYICYSNVCNLYGGSLYDSNGYLRYWRGAYFAPYDQFRPGTGNLLSGASLHLVQRSNESFWTGDWGTHNFQVGHATCLNSFNCVDGVWDSGNVTASGDINVTNLYQAMINAGDFGAWMMVMGEDGTTHSFKNFDPGTGPNTGSYVTFTYGGPPPAPSIATPTNAQVYVDPQPSFKVNSVSNPNGSTPLQYEVLVSTGAGATGGLITSGLLNTTQWTIPDGILQDGSTYYVQARSYDPITNSYSGWGASIPFRIDMRTGKDKTQTFDTLGPVDIDLATGNAMTGASTHTSAALGGSLGVSLDYNTPLKSRNGLVGKYWNNQTMAGDPLVTRVDQNVDFNWDTGSPSAGTIPNDNFSAQWTGYFVAPATGAFSFGASNDDLVVIKVNGQQVYANGGCYSGNCYGTSISLAAGQVVPIEVDYVEATGPAYARVFVKGPVDEQVLPQAWLQTGVRPVSSSQGLSGSYYGNFDGTNTFSANNPLLMKRNDTYLSFNWGSGAPMPNGPDSFLVRWTGYITVPTTGTYTFGARSDDGTKITVGTGNTVVYNDWTLHSAPASPTWGTGYALTANTPVPITIEYYDAYGNASFEFWAQGAVPTQIVPSAWLSSKTQVLPSGWNLGIDPDGNVNYDHIKINQSSAVLTDSTGDTHEYKWDDVKKAYIPPANEDGQLLRNADGTFTMQDTDGRTYIFSADGTLKSLTNPVDDRKPAALQYTYASINGGPATLTQITDAVDTSRWAQVYYSGDSNCGSAPSGFDASAPAGMICAVKTNDGRATYLYYVQGQLARIQKPGNEITDYRYEAVQNNGVTIGYRITSIRDSLANDAIAAGVRADDDTTKTQLGYDILGRITSVTQPAGSAGEARTQHIIEYLPGALDKSYYGATQQHIVGAAEPNGFTRRVQYDNLFRTIQDTDIANLSDITEWDGTKDLAYSTTDETGMKTTTVYDDEDRAVSSYGPAQAAWFDTTNPRAQVPLSAYASQIPRTDTSYDENIVGPAVAWFDYTKQTGNTSGVLSGAPKLHTTGINTAAPGTLSYDFASPPVTASAGVQGIGLSATGKLRLPNGTYTVSADTSDGIRIWVDDTLVTDSWIDSAYRTTSSTFTIADSLAKRLRIDVYRRTGSTGTLNIRIQQSGGFGATTDWSSYLKPDYSLTTSTKTYDSTLGNSTTTTNYGTNPELGLAQTSNVDPTGLNLTTTSTYETQGATGSFLRQTAKYLPGANTSVASTGTQYAYYGATETKDNPCTTGTTEAYKQAGFLKLKTEPDPDGTGSQTPRTTETIYDDAGRIVATRYNTDSWTCTTYDTRGRVTQTAIPAFNGQAARTITNNYAVGGNPLVTSTADVNGTIQTTIDLLGRTRQYVDAYGDSTAYDYTPTGELSQKYGDMGTEVFLYDSYRRLVNDQFDGTTYATVSYDAYGRVDHIDYNNAGQMRLTYGRDALGRTTSMTYRMGDGTTTVVDTVNRTQSNQINIDTVSSGAASMTWTYGYDGADRITSANTTGSVGSHTYSYGYGTQNSTLCGTGNGTNPNSGRNGNRTTQTIDGATTNFCYDYADRLTNSSNALYASPHYDTHGNMTQLGTVSAPLNLYYDSSDRNWAFESYDSNGNGVGIYYARDAQGRLITRTKNTITNWSWVDVGDYFYGYTGSGDTPDFVRDPSWAITEKTLELPGGVVLIVKPQQSGNNQKQYSLPNIHGDNILTANAAGTNTSTGTGPANSYVYDPFGQALVGTTALPANADFASYGYVGQHEKFTESSFTLLSPMQMGARVYLPGIGRFAQVDPVEGGSDNNYTYPTDPVNEFDLTGQFGWKTIGKLVLNAAHVAQYVPGPIGMAATGVAVAANLAAGNRVGALAEAAGFIPGGKMMQAGGKLFRFSTHALVQRQERKISTEMVAHAINNGVRMNYREQGVRKVGYYHESTAIFVATRGRKILTVINKVNRNYVRNVALRGRR